MSEEKERAQSPEMDHVSGYDLRHAFVRCDKPSCRVADEHCYYEWCGAPKNHSMHIGGK